MNTERRRGGGGGELRVLTLLSGIVALNRKTRVLPSVILSTFVVYSHQEHP